MVYALPSSTSIPTYSPIPAAWLLAFGKRKSVKFCFPVTPLPLVHLCTSGVLAHMTLLRRGSFVRAFVCAPFVHLCAFVQSFVRSFVHQRKPHLGRSVGVLSDLDRLKLGSQNHLPHSGRKGLL